MFLKFLFLQNFRNKSQAEFSFSKKTNLIVGHNAVGKTNLLEAIFLLSVGKSFRAEKDDQMVRFGESVARVAGDVQLGDPSFAKATAGEEDTRLEVVINSSGQGMHKKYSVNGVSRRRNVFAGVLSTVIFLPTDLDIVIGQPLQRRRFLGDVLEQVDDDYALAMLTYTKALRQRNALLERVRETGVRNEKYFAYWDSLLITNGQIVSKKREEFISFINKREKGLYEFGVVYDKSEISSARLEKYRQAEVGAGVTLVGPHRDDVLIQNKKELAVKNFASRGQQRLVVLELKLSQIAYIEERTGGRPLLLLDDIFSELDEEHVGHVLKLLPDYQCVITTTNEEFLGGLSKSNRNVIELKKQT